MSVCQVRFARVRGLALFAVLLVPAIALSVEKRPPRPASATLDKILGERTIWGKDFGDLARIVANADAAGEKTLLLFPDRVVAAGKSASLDEAATLARRFAQAAQGEPPKLKPRFRFLSVLAGESDAATLRPEAAAFPEDDSFRVVWSRAGAEFVKPDLTIKRIRQLLGPSRAPTTLVVQTEYERRPIILTLYSYAGGSIVFAESDLAPAPGLVDRVLLDVPKVARALFAE